MATYMVSYDLVKNRNYNSLFEALRSYANWAHIHLSVWAVVSNATSEQVRDHLLQHMDNDDRLIVIRSGDYASWRGVLCDSDWLKKNL